MRLRTLVSRTIADAAHPTAETSGTASAIIATGFESQAPAVLAPTSAVLMRADTR